MEASAKSGFNAQQIFVEAARILYEDYLKYKRNDSVGTFKPINENNNQKINNNTTTGKKAGCC